MEPFLNNNSKKKKSTRSSLIQSKQLLAVSGEENPLTMSSSLLPVSSETSAKKKVSVKHLQQKRRVEDSVGCRGKYGGKDEEKAEILNAFFAPTVFKSEISCCQSTQPPELEDRNGE